MKRMKLLLIMVALFIMTAVTIPIQADTASTRQAVFFKETTCLVCANLEGYLDGPGGAHTETDDYIKKLEDQGVTVITYDIMANPVVDQYSYTNNDGDFIKVTAIDVFAAFNSAYNRSNTDVPVIFAGDTYFDGLDNLKTAITDGTIYNKSAQSLLDINVEEGQAYSSLTGFIGFLLVLGAGLLDGFNPCAIALLLLFISLLGFSKDKKVLILVSTVYIFALFVSYFLIGTFFLGILEKYTTQIALISSIVNWVVLVLVFLFFAFNFYDFLQARKHEYGKIKNQLPKWLQRYNKKIMKVFTGAINSENKSGLIPVLSLTFVLGITLSITELVCTGQIYFGILYGIHTIHTGYAYILLLFYNVMFVMPLIIIAITAIKLSSIVTVSNWIREHMAWIKLANSILFFGIFLFFLYRVIV